MSKLAIFGVILASVLLAASARPDADKVDLSTIPQIPAGPFNNFSTYSGYITLDANTSLSRSYHYFFVTSMSNQTTDPVLLWLNGGPGCSSMAGLLNEVGPWVFGPNGTVLEFNPYSWNAKANVLYIETPTHVGFSYGPNITYNDTFTAQENDRVLRQFFTEFSDFQSNEFYISGESYAGIYIPSLAQTIHWSNVGGATPRVNLKGVAIGNGVVQVSDQEETLSQLMFFRRHNLISPEDAFAFESVCHFNYNATACTAVANAIFSKLASAPLNPYDIYGYCYNDSQMVLPSSAHYNYVRFKNFIARASDIALEDVNPFADLPPCADIVGATFFLNNKTVKAGLHVPDNITWTVCSGTLNYTGGDFANMTETYQFLMSEGYRIVYYSGDSDSVCPYDTAEIFFRNLVKTYNLPTLVPKKPWHIPGIYSDEPQTTGFYEDYPNLRFMTFMGVGHMVPQWNRPGGQKMINTFLHQIALD